MTFETVATETPATSATSLIVTRCACWIMVNIVPVRNRYRKRLTRRVFPGNLKMLAKSQRRQGAEKDHEEALSHKGDGRKRCACTHRLRLWRRRRRRWWKFRRLGRFW